MSEANVEYNLRRVAEALIHIECGRDVALGHVAAGALNDLCRAAMEYENLKGDALDLRRDYRYDEGLPNFYNDHMSRLDESEEGDAI